MKKILFVSLCALLLCACNSPDTYRVETINNQYSLEIIDFMKAATDLNDVASCQYSNEAKELYAVVIDESKESLNETFAGGEPFMISLEDYVMFCETNLKENLNDYTPLQKVDTVINGFHAIKLCFTAKLNGADVYYNTALVEGMTHFYEVITWTLDRYREAHNHRMNHMLNSFQELEATAMRQQ